LPSFLRFRGDINLTCIADILGIEELGLMQKYESHTGLRYVEQGTLFYVVERDKETFLQIDL
jgi:hypothetical protein